MTWKLSDAKNRFSEVVRLALSGKPQRVERNGDDAVVVIDASELQRLQGEKPSFKKREDTVGLALLWSDRSRR